MPPKALLSVSDKSGLVDLAKALTKLGFELIASGGTAKTLAAERIAHTPVEAYTGHPEIFGGRVKTLHPKIAGGILQRRGIDDAQAAQHQIPPIDLVVVNLYPFAETAARGAPFDELVEQIDIGGPTLIRAAAKGAPGEQGVGVLVDPTDYDVVVEELQKRGALSLATRLRLMRVAFAHTAAYDAAIADELEARREADNVVTRGFPDRLQVSVRRERALRYGENPHQAAAFYRLDRLPQEPCLPAARVLAGKELSYNNLLDLEAALSCVKEFDRCAAVIIKHANPCGVALGDNARDTYLRARNADPISAFGGIVALNRTVDVACAEAIAETFVEAVVAPRFEPDALKALASKKALRLLELESLELAPHEWQRAPLEMRSVAGGLLVQTRDLSDEDPMTWKAVTKREATLEERRALAFAWRVARHVKSNAIVLAKENVTVGVGMGQTNRVDAVRHAAQRAGDRAPGSVLASDAFFPFPDGVLAAADAGVAALAQPGGSTRDAETIAAADARGMAMLFTGVRHFRH